MELVRTSALSRHLKFSPTNQLFRRFRIIGNPHRRILRGLMILGKEAAKNNL